MKGKLRFQGALFVTKGHKVVRLENQWSVHSVSPPRGLYDGQSHSTLPAVTNPWPWFFSLQRHWSGHLGAQDSRLPVYLFVLFRRRHLLGPHAALEVHDLTHLWAKGKGALSTRCSNPHTRSQGLVRGGQAGLWPRLVPSWTPGLHSGVRGSSGGLARGRSTENQGKTPLGFFPTITAREHLALGR